MVETKHRVIIETDRGGEAMTVGGLMERAAQGFPIHGRSLVHPELDDPASELVHHHQDPMGFEKKRLTNSGGYP